MMNKTLLFPTVWLYTLLLSLFPLVVQAVPIIDPLIIVDSLQGHPEYIIGKHPVYSDKRTQEPFVSHDAHPYPLTVNTFLFNGAPIDAKPLVEILEKYRDRALSDTDMKDLIREVTTYVRKQGNILGIVSAQITDPRKDTLNLVVEQFSIDTIEITGNTSIMTNRMLAYINPVLHNISLTKAELERSILLLDSMAGLKVQAQLVNSKTNTKASTLVLNLRQTNYFFIAKLDNKGTKYVGPWMASSNFYINNPIGNNEQITLTGIKTPNNNSFDMISGVYKQPFGNKGWWVSLAATKASAYPVNNLKSQNIKSVSESMILGFFYPLIHSRYQTLFFKIGAAEISAKEEVRQKNTFTKDHLREIYASFKYDFFDTWNGENLYILDFHKGLNGFGATKKSSTTKSRSRGTVDYFDAHIFGRRVQFLPKGFQFTNQIRAQWASHALLSSRRFNIGGPPHNMAYPTSTFAGDRGLDLSTEIAYVSRKIKELEFLMPFISFTYAQVWNQDRAAGEFKSRTLNGYTFGIRLKVIKGLTAFIEQGVPLKKRIQNINYGSQTYLGFSYGVPF